MSPYPPPFSRGNVAMSGSIQAVRRDNLQGSSRLVKASPAVDNRLGANTGYLVNINLAA